VVVTGERLLRHHQRVAGPTLFRLKNKANVKASHRGANTIGLMADDYEDISRRNNFCRGGDHVPQ
jgi:hypothetical protein